MQQIGHRLTVHGQNFGDLIIGQTETNPEDNL